MQLHIYSEGDLQRGLGHLVRCMAYACAWRQRGGEVTWIVDGDNHALRYLQAETVVWAAWQHQLPLSFLPGEWDVALADSYSATEALLSTIAATYAQVVYLDDTFRLAYPRGLVVHGAPGGSGDRAGDADWLCGPAWQPLRPAFWSHPEARAVKEQVEQILIIMGGTDVRNLLPLAAEQARHCFPLACIHVVLGAGATTVPDGVICHRNLNDEQMAALMKQCDLAISAAGQTSFELLACRLPAVLIQIADNQSNQLAQWVALKVFRSAGHWQSPALAAHLSVALHDLESPVSRRAFIDAMDAIPCGQGAGVLVKLLVCQKYLKQVLSVPGGVLIPFCLLSRALALAVLALRNTPDVANQMICSRAIPEEEHLGFIEAQRQDCFNVNYGFFEDEQLLGVVALQRIDWHEGLAWLDIYKNVFLRQRGLGARLLDAIFQVAFQYLQLNTIMLQVKQDNDRAIHFYLARGFVLCGQGESHKHGLLEMKYEYRGTYDPKV